MRKWFCAVLMLAMLSAIADSAFARRGSGRGGSGRSGHSGTHHGGQHPAGAKGAPTRFVGGGAVFVPWYLSPGLPHAVVEPPVFYVEKGVEENATAPVPTYWYYCPEAEGYYPDVTACALGWVQFVSQAP